MALTTIGDPHITPFNGPKFDFTGSNGEFYNFIDSQNFRMNMRMRGRELTVVSEAGILLFGVEKYHIIANEDETGYIEVRHNDQLLKHGYSMKTNVGKQTETEVTVTAKKFTVTTKEFEVTLQWCNNGVHVYNKVPHLDNSSKCFIEFENNVHGIAGQTVNPEFQKIEGEESDYLVSGPFSNDFKYRIDAEASIVLPTTEAISAYESEITC